MTMPVNVHIYVLYIQDKMHQILCEHSAILVYIILVCGLMWALWVHCLLHIMCKLNEFSGVNTERWFGALRRLVPTLAASFRLLTWIRIPWLTCCWLELQCTWAQKKMSRDESTSTGSRYRKLVQSDNFCQTSAKSHKIKELFLFFLRYRITNLSMSIL